MKFCFSLIFIISLPVFAGRINIQFVPKQKVMAKYIKSILTQKYNIPSELVQLSYTKECKKGDSYTLQICVLRKNDFTILATDKIRLIRESLSIFYKDSKDDV